MKYDTVNELPAEGAVSKSDIEALEDESSVQSKNSVLQSEATEVCRQMPANIG